MPRDYKEVFTIIETAEDKKNRWCKIGIAFTNKDDSLNVYLDALPINGKMHIRDKRERQEQAPPDDFA